MIEKVSLSQTPDLKVSTPGVNRDSLLISNCTVHKGFSVICKLVLECCNIKICHAPEKAVLAEVEMYDVFANLCTSCRPLSSCPYSPLSVCIQRRDHRSDRIWVTHHCRLIGRDPQVCLGW